MVIHIVCVGDRGMEVIPPRDIKSVRPFQTIEERSW